MQRWWNYPTAEFECFSRPFWDAISVARETGATPTCIRCRRPVLVKNDCEPICLACAFPEAHTDRTWHAEHIASLKLRPLRQPSCAGLILNPTEVLRVRENVPDHICEFVLRNSTMRWANQHLLPVQDWPVPASVDSPYGPDWDYWQTRWPLPIGRTAVVERAEAVRPQQGPLRFRPVLELVYTLASTPAPEQMPPELAHDYELAVAAAGALIEPRAPFDGSEQALLALRVVIDARALDIFGLGLMTDWCVVHLGALKIQWADGVALSPSELQHPVVVNVQRLWRRVRREKEKGRPLGTGLFTGRDECISQLRGLSREALTLEQAARMLSCPKETLKYQFHRWGFANWAEVRRTVWN